VPDDPAEPVAKLAGWPRDDGDDGDDGIVGQTTEGRGADEDENMRVIGIDPCIAADSCGCLYMDYRSALEACPPG
jgi:hypothetical protein